MRTTYEDGEQALHHAAVRALAREIRQSIENVTTVYEGELARLKSNAKVRDYLVLLASRRTREKLLGKRNT